MLAFSFDWRLLVGATLTYYATLVFYRLFLHPLARYPGPKLAAISRWYEAYYDVVLNGKYTKKIAELHKIYGLFAPSLPLFSRCKPKADAHRSNHSYQPARAPCYRSRLFRHLVPYRWCLAQVCMGIRCLWCAELYDLWLGYALVFSKFVSCSPDQDM
jgi:hypothetical protein